MQPDATPDKNRARETRIRQQQIVSSLENAESSGKTADFEVSAAVDPDLVFFIDRWSGLCEQIQAGNVAMAAAGSNELARSGAWGDAVSDAREVALPCGTFV